eukprot:364039-Chlamydomonas_euryale.AAC.5
MPTTTTPDCPSPDSAPHTALTRTPHSPDSAPVRKRTSPPNVSSESQLSHAAREGRLLPVHDQPAGVPPQQPQQSQQPQLPGGGSAAASAAAELAAGPEPAGVPSAPSRRVSALLQRSALASTLDLMLGGEAQLARAATRALAAHVGVDCGAGDNQDGAVRNPEQPETALSGLRVGV